LFFYLYLLVLLFLCIYRTNNILPVCERSNTARRYRERFRKPVKKKFKSSWIFSPFIDFICFASVYIVWIITVPIVSFLNLEKHTYISIYMNY
jgi:hypothetical protein